MSDFRAVRRKLEPHEFAISEGQDVAPTDLVDEATWAGIVHLPDDVAIRISDHNGLRLALLYSLWGDWITATGDPENPDELFSCMLDAGDALQCAHFLFLHGYYRAAMGELRTALELVMIGAYGNLRPDDTDFVVWKTSGSELGFTRVRRRMHAMLRGDQCKWLVADDEFPDKTFRQLCDFTHSRPNSSEGALWQSNGPVYAHEAVMLTFLRHCRFTRSVIFLSASRGRTLPFPRIVESCSRKIGCQTGKALRRLLSNCTKSAPLFCPASHNTCLKRR